MNWLSPCAAAPSGANGPSAVEDTAEAAEELARLQHAAGAGSAAEAPGEAPPPVGMANPALSPRASAFQTAAAQRCAASRGAGQVQPPACLPAAWAHSGQLLGIVVCAGALSRASMDHLHSAILPPDGAGLARGCQGRAARLSAGPLRVPTRTQPAAAALLRQSTGWSRASAR